MTTCCTESETCSVERVGDTILVSCATCGNTRAWPAQDEPLVAGVQGRTDAELALASTAWAIVGMIAALVAVTALAVWVVR